MWLSGFSETISYDKPGFLMQHTSVSPDRRLIAIVGDHEDGLLVDSQSGKVKFLRNKSR